MSYLKVKKQIEQGKINNVYLFHGTQTFLMEDLVQSIIKQVLGPVENPNIITYNTEEILLDLIIEEAETVSFFGGKKVIIVKDFLLPTSLKQDTKLDHDIGKLEQYIERPLEDSFLIFLSPAEKLDARKKITKMLKAKATVVDCAAFDEKMLDEWLEAESKERGFRFTAEGKRQMLERVGSQLFLLATEMEKISLYVGQDGTVTDEIVDLLVPRTLEQNIFALIDFALKQKLDQALIIYHDLIKQKEEPLKILALIARQLRIYYQVKELTKRSYSQKQIASQLKLHPYVVKLAAEQINRYDENRLKSLLEETAETDYAIKTGKMDSIFAVELLLMKLARI